MIKSPHDPSYQRLIAYLKAVRTERGLSIRDLGKLLDEPNQLVSNVETGMRRLTVHEYVQYCAVLEIDPKAALDFLIDVDAQTDPPND